MPLFEYRCEACAVEFEVLQRMSDPILETWKECKVSKCRLQKKLSPFASHISGQIPTRSQALEIPSQNPFTPGPVNNDPVHICSKYCSHHTTSGKLD
jgi:putative FmdB family regulatory protein